MHSPTRLGSSALQIIGVGAAVVGDMASRPNWGLNELDFVFATLVVGSIVNFSLMYLLAPTGPAGAAAGGGLLARIFSEQILTSWGAPGVCVCGGGVFCSGEGHIGNKGLNDQGSVLSHHALGTNFHTHSSP